MSTKFLVEDLKAALLAVKPAISQQQHVPILSHLCFTGEEVYAWDDIMGLTHALETDFVCAVPATLVDVLQAYPSGETVTLTHDNGNLKVACGKRLKVAFPTLPSDQFLYAPDKFGQGDKAFKITPRVIEALKICLPCVGDSAHRVSLTGVVVTKEGDMWSTDNQTITICESVLKKSPATFVLPKNFAEQLPAHNGATVHLADTYVTLVDADGYVAAVHTLMTGIPEDWKQIYDDVWGDPTTEEVPQELEQALALAGAVLQSDTKKSLKVQTDGKKLHVSALSTAKINSTAEDSMKSSLDAVDTVTVNLQPFQRAAKTYAEWQMGITEKSIGFTNGGSHHLISVMKD